MRWLTSPETSIPRREKQRRTTCLRPWEPSALSKLEFRVVSGTTLAGGGLGCERHGTSRRWRLEPAVDWVVSGTALAAGGVRNRRLAPCRSRIAPPTRGENLWITIRPLSRAVMCVPAGQAAKQALALATVLISHVNPNFASPQDAGKLRKMAESGETVVDTESQSCHSTVTSPCADRPTFKCTEN